MTQTVAPEVQIPALWLSPQAHMRVCGKQVFAEWVGLRLWTSCPEPQIVCEKLCQVTRVYGNIGEEVFRHGTRRRGARIALTGVALLSSAERSAGPVRSRVTSTAGAGRLGGHTPGPQGVV